MRYLKTFNEASKSTIKLKDDELELFNTQGSLRNLITDDKISLINNEVFYDKSDDSVVNILRNYFDI